MDRESEDIIRVLGEEGEATISRVMERVGLTWYITTLRLEDLKADGYVVEGKMGFPKARRFRLSEKGRMLYEALKRGEDARAAEPVKADVESEVYRRARSAAEKAAALDPQKLMDLSAGFLEKPPAEVPKPEILAKMAEDVSARISVAVYPPPPPEAGGAAVEAALAALGRILMDKRIHRDAVKAGRLILHLTLEAPNELGEEVFWTLVLPSLLNKQ